MACPMPVSGPHFHDVREFAVMARPGMCIVHAIFLHFPLCRIFAPLNLCERQQRIYRMLEPEGGIASVECHAHGGALFLPMRTSRKHIAPESDDRNRGCIFCVEVKN